MTVIKFITVFALLFFPALPPVVQAQPKMFPNELSGYEFFAKGKLKALQLGVSTKEDVKRIFGAECEYYCDYDADWTISFSYYDVNTSKEEIGKNGERKIYKLDPKYLSHLQSIELRPKKQISLSGISFPNNFKRFTKERQSTMIQRDRSRITTFELFQDETGLTYELYDKADNAKTENRYDKGDLSSILYSIPKEEEKQMFIEELEFI